ncbi:recombinase family protein [Roseococcus sp. SYP-B2431]|nr:recombinase family protein [Roseococcus sp. SYP-B2431]
MSALFLKDLAQKTHRGLEGRVRTGRSGGGLSYGYRVRRGLRADGTPITGEMEIAAEEASIVRRIFAAYAGGQSPRSIAKQLNAEGVPGPRGGKWTASLLLGGAGRETGLLRNRLYVGERVWNRQRFIKDPNTGKRVARPNPREAWVISAAPELAIIDAEVWEAAQGRLADARRILGAGNASDATTDQSSPGNIGTRLASARRPTWPLSGLVRCGVCHGLLSVMGSKGRLGCANHVERGTCSNPRTLLRDVLLRRVLVGLKERLLAPELVEEFVHTYVTEVNAANRDIGARRAGLEQQRAKLARQIRNLLELLKDGHGGVAMATELRDLERRQETLGTEIVAAGVPELVPTLHPNLPGLYRRHVERLEAALADPTTAMAATEALRGLIDAILVFPGERRGELTVTLRGDLAAFLHAANSTPNAETAAALVGHGRSGFGRVVLGSLDAGTGFEPVTFRL